MVGSQERIELIRNACEIHRSTRPGNLSPFSDLLITLTQLRQPSPYFRCRQRNSPHPIDPQRLDLQLSANRWGEIRQGARPIAFHKRQPRHQQTNPIRKLVAIPTIGQPQTGLLPTGQKLNLTFDLASFRTREPVDQSFAEHLLSQMRMIHNAGSDVRRLYPQRRVAFNANAADGLHHRNWQLVDIPSSDCIPRPSVGCGHGWCLSGCGRSALALFLKLRQIATARQRLPRAIDSFDAHGQVLGQ